MSKKQDQAKPFFSIITVIRNDAWALLKTARSIFEQDFQDFEYIIVDGASEDGTNNLIEFWKIHGLITRSISEPDSGVYNAMNKGLQLATGQFVLFLNANDIFASSDVLQQVRDMLQNRALEGLLGWGELNGQIWASWTESEAFKLASLGFCHQALYVRRELLLDTPFDERTFKTDSDTLQLGNLYAKAAKIAIFPKVLVIRGGDPGISADLERSTISIRATLQEEYPALSEDEIEQILTFRRYCTNPDGIMALLDRATRSDARLALHLACMVLDTLYLNQSRELSQTICHGMLDQSVPILLQQPEGGQQLERLIIAQTHRAALMRTAKDIQRKFDKVFAQFEQEEDHRIRNIREADEVNPQRNDAGLIISLTSFPARLKTVSFAIQSLIEQTHPPKAIHLWLGRDEIPNQNWLPKRLRLLEERGLQIHFADRTRHHYDKFLHNAQLNQAAPLVIVDDDVIYPPHALQHLIEGQQRHPEAVIANRCHRIGLTAEGQIAPYRDWEREVHLPQPSFGLMPTGAGGVLYPPGFLSDPLVTDIPTLLGVAPYADDLWLKVCALVKNLRTFATTLSKGSCWYHRYTPSMREGSLMALNLDRGLNDLQVRRAFAWLSEQRPDWFAQYFSVEQEP
jgi:glycosyltransferase involved in cell wall biosynthesis